MCFVETSGAREVQFYKLKKNCLRSRLDCEPHWLIPKHVLSNYFLGLAQSDAHSGSRALSCSARHVSNMERHPFLPFTSVRCIR